MPTTNAFCKGLPLPAHNRRNHNNKDNAACNDAHHNGEIVVFRPSSVGIVACVRRRVFCVAVQALERVPRPFRPVEGAHRVCRAFPALGVAGRVRERSERAWFLHFTVDALVACFARLALVATARSKHWCFANISEVAAFGALDDALGHAAAFHSNHSSLAPLLDHLGIGDVRFDRTSGCIASDCAARKALFVARLADVVAVNQRVVWASLHATACDGSETDAFRDAHTPHNNTGALRVARPIKFVAKASHAFVGTRPNAAKASLAQVAARDAPVCSRVDKLIWLARLRAAIAIGLGDQARANTIFRIWSSALSARAVARLAISKIIRPCPGVATGAAPLSKVFKVPVSAPVGVLGYVHSARTPERPYCRIRSWEDCV